MAKIEDKVKKQLRASSDNSRKELYKVIDATPTKTNSQKLRITYGRTPKGCSMKTVVISNKRLSADGRLLEFFHEGKFVFAVPANEICSIEAVK